MEAYGVDHTHKKKPPMLAVLSKAVIGGLPVQALSDLNTRRVAQPVPQVKTIVLTDGFLRPRLGKDSEDASYLYIHIAEASRAGCPVVSRYSYRQD
jgi:hypothetical protein